MRNRFYRILFQLDSKNLFIQRSQRYCKHYWHLNTRKEIYSPESTYNFTSFPISFNQHSKAQLKSSTIDFPHQLSRQL